MNTLPVQQKMQTIVDTLIKASGGNSPLSVAFRTLTGAERRFTYNDIFRHSLTFAGHLKNKGLNAGDRVAIILSTCPEFAFAFFGTVIIGGIPVPVAPPLFGLKDMNYYMNRVDFILKDSGSKFLVSTGSDILLFQENKQCINKSFQYINVSGINFHEQKNTDYVLPDPDQVCYIQYTSGSTGAPKGVALTHDNIVKNIEGIGRAVQEQERECVVSWLPLYHDMGLVGGLLFPVYHNASLVLMPPELFVAKPLKWLEYITFYRATMSPGNNFAFAYCLTKIKEDDLHHLDLSSWRVAFNGSEPIDINVIEKFYEKFKRAGYRKTTMLPCYGLAEATLGVTLASVHEEPRSLSCDSVVLYLGAKIKPKNRGPGSTRLVSVGKPICGLEINIFGEDGEELEEGFVGRIGVAGGTVMKGYVRDFGYEKDLYMDKWLITGDTGFVYDDNLYITGREKEMIIVRGKNFSLVDIENVLNGTGGITDALAAFGYKDPENGSELLGIVIETKEKDTAVLDNIKEQIRRKVLNDFGFQPQKIVFTPPHSIPRTINGKIRRNYCGEYFVAEGETDGKEKIADNQTV